MYFCLYDLFQTLHALDRNNSCNLSSILSIAMTIYFLNRSKNTGWPTKKVTLYYIESATVWKWHAPPSPACTLLIWHPYIQIDIILFADNIDLFKAIPWHFFKKIPQTLLFPLNIFFSSKSVFLWINRVFKPRTQIRNCSLLIF